MGFAERLKHVRKNKGLTQKELADILEIPYQGISQYERGVRQPKYRTIERLAKALNCDISELVTPAEESQLIINGLCEGIKEQSNKRKEAQSKAESEIDGDYFVYFANFLIEHADIICILNSAGIKITVTDRSHVSIKHGFLTQMMTTSACINKITKLNESFGNSLYDFGLGSLSDSTNADTPEP